MSGYVRSFTETFEFDGDNVEVIFKPISKKDLMKVTPIFASLDKKMILEAQAGEMTDIKKGSELMDAMYMAACETMPKYIESMKGLIDDDGAAIDKDEIFQVAYFSELVSGMFGALISRASVQTRKKDDPPKAKDEKKQ